MTHQIHATTVTLLPAAVTLQTNHRDMSVKRTPAALHVNNTTQVFMPLLNYHQQLLFNWSYYRLSCVSGQPIASRQSEMCTGASGKHFCNKLCHM